MVCIRQKFGLAVEFEHFGAAFALEAVDVVEIVIELNVVWNHVLGIIEVFEACFAAWCVAHRKLVA